MLDLFSLYDKSFEMLSSYLGWQLETSLTAREEAARIIFLLRRLQLLQILLSVTRVDVLIWSSVVHEKRVVPIAD